jgi:hypothetical protein
MKKMYGLFVSEQKGKKWIYTRMMPKASFYKAEAERVFAPVITMLLIDGQKASLRPVKRYF